MMYGGPLTMTFKKNKSVLFLLYLVSKSNLNHDLQRYLGIVPPARRSAKAPPARVARRSAVTAGIPSSGSARPPDRTPHHRHQPPPRRRPSAISMATHQHRRALAGALVACFAAAASAVHLAGPMNDAMVACGQANCPDFMARTVTFSICIGLFLLNIPCTHREIRD
eukprot:SAG31_NODE_720_length_12587_cov_15.393114_4_plen_167_part_00